MTDSECCCLVSCQLCYLYADMHKQTSSKESRRFFMEFHSLFLDRSAVRFSLQSSSCLWSRIVLHSWYISECSSCSVSGSRTLKCRCQRRSQLSWVRDGGRGVFSAMDRLQCSSGFIHLSEWRVVMFVCFLCVCVCREAQAGADPRGAV